MAVSPVSPALHVPTSPVVLPPAEPGALSTPVAASSEGQGANNNGSPDPRHAGQHASTDTALDEINSQLQAWSTELKFEMDPDLQKIVVSVRDSESGEVLRTIPSDAVIRIAKMIVKLQGNAVKTTA
ncbi:flagellar protein FlaG [Bordetella avium]|uniref:Flagellar protein n=1 Tax=Bordetella avium (strain 197N) TaxID=360910 RepID=Q2L173_BORA1|nr:flagellar protein FlaG [Bordetella avium]AZY49098.1 flagellar protein [Bordetella avium]AZY52456.1 flagellar protein [Bordetella avium]RIQ12249.1 flagellar protein [Bordetella avium]RIQ19379.1 flagellar protein [Bordetella avium]RIQ33548.1 flagellar protein [Bordetella avium]